MTDGICFAGLDVHARTTVAAAVQLGSGEVFRARLGGANEEAIGWLQSLPGPVRAVYEAGPTGFGLARAARTAGIEVMVCSPGAIPRQPGDRVKTDARDALKLARLHAAGQLRPVLVPEPELEALRDLVRAREGAVGVATQAKHRLKAFLLRQGRRYPGRTGWTQPYRRWLADLSVPLAPQHIALQEYRDTIDETERRVERLTEPLRQHTPAWRWAPVVDALQALRGVSFVTAVSLVAEIGDIRRFAHPRQLMAFLGLVPSEYSSGPSVRRGGITKAGNPHARRVRAEAAWAYQGIPRLGRQALYRQEALPKAVCDIAWKAQLRLTSRFRRLVARGKAKPTVATAIARELTGFIWAIARAVPPPAA